MMKRVGFRVTATFAAVFVAVFTASTAVEIYAQSWGYDGNRIAISADGETIASASDDGTIHLWDVQTGQIQRAFPAPISST